MQRIVTTLLLAAVLAFTGVMPALADEVSVAVAANFAPPLQKIAAEFQAKTGHVVKPSSGATGGLYAQVKAGAPFDVFFSADDERPAKMEEEGLGVKGTRFTYALGKLVLWSAKPGVVDSKGEVLVKGSFSKLAIANPKVAPYGAAAQQTLAMMGLWEATESKRVMGENLGPTYQFISSGNADLGFVALSQVIADPNGAKGSQWIVPEKMYNPIKQDAILLEHGKNNKAARELLAYIQSDEGRKLIRSFGYDVP